MGLAKRLDCAAPGRLISAADFSRQQRPFQVRRRRVAADLLPADIVRRPKAGFHVPIPGWLKGELRPLLTDVLSPERVRRHGVFDPDAVDALVRAHLDGRRNLSRELWGLLMFGLWFERHLA